VTVVNFCKSILGYTAHMRRSFPVVLISALYVMLLLIGLLFPREALAEPTPMGFLEKIFHDILFLSGPPEVFLNFLLFIPFYFALLYLAPALTRPWAALVSCLTSAAAELAQSQIPGRVSSWRDFLSNCLGVVVAFAFLTARSK
jgi:glycopeptide antibiotics resistance protein